MDDRPAAHAGQGTEPRDASEVASARDWRGRERSRGGRDTGTLVWGLILLAVGTWFFLEQTLGVEMPNVDWGDLWPLILIVIGGAVILQGLGRRGA